MVLLILINGVLTFAFYPYNYARIDVHNIETKAYDDLFVGSSHGKCAIDPLVIDEITGRKSTNLCMGGEYIQDSYFLVKEAVRNHKPSRIIYELDPGYWKTDPVEGTDFGSFYHEFPISLVKLEYFWDKMKDADFRTTLFPWYLYRQQMIKNPIGNIKMKLGEEYRTYSGTPFTNEAQSYEKEGFIYRKVIKDVKKGEENLILWEEDSLRRETAEDFERLVKYCKDEEIELVVITTPIPKKTLKKNKKAFREADKYFTEYMDSLNISYYNFNYIKLKETDRSLKGFADQEGHMYGENARHFSEELARYLKRLRNKKATTE